MGTTSWKNELRWIKNNTPHTRAALDRFPHRSDCRLCMRFHLDLKMLPVIEALSEKVSLQVIPCHRDTTHPQGFEHLVDSTLADVREDWRAADCLEHLNHDSPYVCDLGGEIICWAIREGVFLKGALEGTTSGLRSIRELALTHPPKFPILNWNDARLKRQIHNEKMVGFSLWHTFTQVTQLSLHGKCVGVFGFGPVGRGIARTAMALGGRVLVYDPNPESQVLARFEGIQCPGRQEVLRESEILVTATGQDDVLHLQDLVHSPDGIILLNAGHSEKELHVSIREAPISRALLPHINEIASHKNKKVCLLAQGRLLNLVAGFGDTINAFDLTSAQLVDALNILIESGADHKSGLQVVPEGFFQLSS